IILFDHGGGALDTIFSGRLDPKSLPPYDVPAAAGRDFSIRIQAFNEKGELVYQSIIAVADGKPAEPVRLTPIPPSAPAHKLAALDLSAGTLLPFFHPDSLDYTVTIPITLDSLVVTPR